jgi:hypothetical protein
VSDKFREIRELRDQFIRAVYDLRDPNTGRAMGNAIMQRMGLDPENVDDEARYAEIAQHFEEIESLLRLFSSDLTQHQFKRLRPHAEIRAKGTIENKDGEQDQRDAHGQDPNCQQV